MNVVLELTRIAQAVSLSDSSAEQVKLIVESISRVMNVDVCSIYLVTDSEEMILAASRGLDEQAVGKVRIPRGKGLVWSVAESRHPINLAEPEKHPAYYYIAETAEERYHSFCGVPLVKSGQVIGVVIVQGREARSFSDNEEAFLVTLAAQLALLVPSASSVIENNSTTTLRKAGVKGAPGVGIGVINLCVSGDLYDATDGHCEDVDQAINEWHQLLSHAKTEVNNEREALGYQLSDSVAGIFTAYEMLLADQTFIGRVEELIREGHWLPAALRQATLQLAEVFTAMEDPYLRARGEDIHHLGNKLYMLWRGNSHEVIATADDVILVGDQVSISDIAAVPTGRLAGIICYEGSSLSHTAVLANAMGVPAVMGVGYIKSLKGGETAIVDGNQGQAIINPGDLVRQEFERLVGEDRQLNQQLLQLRNERAITTDGAELRLFTNTGLLADISPGLKHGAQGVGLYRTEIPFMIHDSFPSEEEQLQVYRQVLKAYAGMPVYMRTLDVGGDKQLPYFPVHEENPALGWRGIRLCLDNSSLLMTQVRAMIRAADGADNLHILLPMVSSTNELDAFHELLNNACGQLADEGVVFYKPKVGIMVEVPAAISQLPFWAKRIDFISIGSNDLSQYLLALDRNNSRVASRYDHIHPAVLHEIHRIVQSAKALGIPLSLCGEMASDPATVVLLLGMGIRTLSMSASKLLRIKWLIRSISAARASELAQQALTMENATVIRQMLSDELQAAGLGALVQ